MRAKFVNEFHKTGNPLGSLGLGTQIIPLKTYDEHIITTPIQNNIKILTCMCDYTWNEKFNTCISVDIREEMTKLFGPPVKKVRYERYTSIWVLRYRNLIFNVYSAKHKGSSVEVHGISADELRNGKMESDIMDFVKELNAMLNTV